MKKVSTFVFVSLLLLSGSLAAQFNEPSPPSKKTDDAPTYRNLKKGTFTFTLQGSGNNSNEKAGWSLTPQAGYLLADRLITGLQLSLANRFSKQEPGWLSLKRGTLTEYAVTSELYTRFYILPFRISPYVQLSSGYSFSKITSRDFYSGARISASNSNFVLFGGLGLSLRTGKHFGLQAQYNHPLVADPQTNDLIRSNRFRLGLAVYL